MPNQLSNQSSLYLQQHADQPVDWMPWGNEAFVLAQKLDKPILLSIGYSACHWCHVMSEESFGDSYIGSLMNRHFICIKVDREERPDVDQTYLEAIRMFNQSAGWPLNVFCLPNGRPFWGGTYFPLEDQGQGIVPWPQVLMRIADHYKREKAELEENANNVVSNLLHANNAMSTSESEWKNQLLLEGAKSICDSHDDQEGGFTPAPKFPSPMKIEFLLAIQESQSVRQNSAFAHKIGQSIQTTLTKMAAGGMYDQIGGGFFRYSVDAQWCVPHFEKMLYDNSLLLSTYSKAHQKYGLSVFKEIVNQTIDWLIQDMRDNNGGFYSSINSDSEEGEGEYYLWTDSEIKNILSDKESEEFILAHRMSEKGNFEDKKSLPMRNFPVIEKQKSFNKQKNTLLEYRRKRVKPSTDKKKITVWNALLIRGLVDSSRAFIQKDWLKTAIDLNEWMTRKLLTEKNEICSISFENDQLSTLSFLDDYAIWAESLLTLSSLSDWIMPGSSTHYIELAEKITLTALEKFKDKQACGFYFNEKSTNNPAQVQKKFWYDNATPSANSSLLRVFSTLYQITNKELWMKEYREAQAGYPQFCRQAPQGVGHALCAITEEAVGLSTLNCLPDQMDAVVRELSCHPYRPIFIFSNNGDKTAVLKIGKTYTEKSDNAVELIKKIFS